MVTRQVISKKKSLPIEKFRIVFNFEWFKKSKQVAKKFDKFDKKLYEWKKENLERTWTLEKKRFGIGWENKVEVSSREISQKLSSKYRLFKKEKVFLYRIKEYRWKDILLPHWHKEQ